MIPADNIIPTKHLLFSSISCLLPRSNLLLLLLLLLNLKAIHEAARSGEVELVEYLFNHGAEIGHLTHGGGSVLFWAKTFQDDSCIGYLEGIGAPDQRDERFDRSGEKQGGGGEEEEGDRDFHILITTTDL